MKDLRTALDFDRLRKAARMPSGHELQERISFSNSVGLPEQVSFAPFFFAIDPRHAIVPHGHHNMVSMHMILEGRARVRQFDREVRRSVNDLRSAG
jgi:hypothetical protein